VLRRRQGRLLVGILALEATHVITCDRLVDLLWGDHPPSRARRVVHSRMSELRTALAQLPDAGRLRAEQAGYVLDIEPEQVDAHRFLGLLARA
jgi:DNA-binding SARP family transcriptional activator